MEASVNGHLRALREGELVSALEAWCDEAGVGAGWLRAFGEVEDVELDIGGSTVHLDEALLVSLDASIARIAGQATVRCAVVVTATRGGLPTTVGGQLRSATCVDVEAALLPFDATGATRRAGPDGTAILEVDATDSVSSAPEAAPAPEPERPAKPATRPVPKKPEPRKPEPRRTESRRAESRRTESRPEPRQPTAKPVEKKDWSAVAALSAGNGWQDDGEVDVDELNRGDTLLHPSLDRCLVINVINDDAVKVRLSTGSVRKLVMRGFRLFREEEGVFRIEKK